MPFASGPGGARIYYEVRSDTKEAASPAVVLVQGLGLSSRFWFDLPERLATGASDPDCIERALVTLSG